MDSRQYLSALRRRWRWIAVPIAAGLILAAAASLLTAERWEATAKVFVSTNFYAGTQPPGINSASEFALGRVQSYAALAVTPAVLTPAARIAGSPVDSGSITATNPPSTSLIDITADAADAATAASEANAVARSLIVVMGQVETRLPDGRSSAKATLVEPASPPSDPSQPKPLLYLLLGLALGLGAGLALAAIREQVGDGSGADRADSGPSNPSA